MPHSRWPMLVPVAMPIVLASCALLLDTSGLSGDAEDAGGAASDAAANESASNDGATPSDAPSDATALGDAPAASCADTFADSFDMGALGATWDGLVETGASLTLVTDSPRSPPNALLVTVDDPSGKATLTKTFRKSKNVCCEAAIAGYHADLSLFHIRGRGDNYNLRVGYGSGTLTVSELLYVGPDDPRNYVRSLTSLTKTGSAWRHLRVELVFPDDAGKGTLSMFDDGALAYRGAIGSEALSIDVDGLVLGVTYSQSSAGAALRYDDVGCSFR